MSSNITITNKLSIQDEGISVVDNAKSLNFIGSAVTATAVGNDVTITVTGGGGGGGVSSVGLSMPSAFTVTNSPILTGGTIAVTGAGLTTDYIRGDGSLAALPAITGSTGTIDRHAKWITTTTLGDSLISDNGTRLNIGGAYVSNTRLSIQTGGSNLYGVNIFAADDALLGYTIADYGTGVSGYAAVGTGVYGESSGYPSFGVGGFNIGVHGKAFETDLPPLTTCIGGKFEASSGANNYSLQLIDGTQGTGKFLKSVTSTGGANWANITAADVSGLIDGGGTLNYLSKWTPDGSSLGDSQIRDDGTTLSIGTAPSPTIQFLIQSNKSRGLSVTGLSIGVYGEVNFTGANGNYYGLYGSADNVTGSPTKLTYGVFGEANGGRGAFGKSTGGLGSTNIGVEGQALDAGLPPEFGTAALNIGGKFTATGATANYSIQLIDGTETVAGRFLKNITTDGKANWATITAADVSGAIDGSGTLNYVPKWTPDGTSLGDSLIYSSATTVQIGQVTTLFTPNNILRVIDDYKYSLFSVEGTSPTGATYALSAQNTVNGGFPSQHSQTATAIQGFANLSSTLNIGVEARTQGNDPSLTTNIGIWARGGVTSWSGLLGIGGKFEAVGVSQYAVQLIDGTETVAGRFLKNMTTDGKANWATLTVADTGLTLTTTGTSGAATLSGNTLNIPQYTPDITGSGNLDYVARWSSASTLGIGALRDNTNTVSVGGSTVSSTKFYVHPDASVDIGIASNAAKSGGIAVEGTSFGAGSATNIGVRGTAQSSTTLSIGVYGSAVASAGTNVGIYGNASGGALNYAIQLVDGTETTSGRFLKNIVDGKANWATLTVADTGLTLTTTGTTGAATLVGNTLNIPQYTGGGTLAQTLVLGNSAGTTDINMNNNDITNIDNVSTSSTTLQMQAVLNSALIFYANNC